ncbi:MAG: hypothetical protein ACPG5P_02550 [Saprospiraceae bacterium]
MTEALTYLKENLESAIEYAAQYGKAKLREQGHYASGKLERSFEAEVEVKLNGIATGKLLVEEYGIDQDTGIPKDQIKYKYTTLLPWIKIIKPSISHKGAIAFAKNIKKKHEEEGMHTKKSKAYSATGRRTGWIKEGILDREKEIEQIIDLAGFLQMVVEDSLDNLES